MSIYEFVIFLSWKLFEIYLTALKQWILLNRTPHGSLCMRSTISTAFFSMRNFSFLKITFWNLCERGGPFQNFLLITFWYNSENKLVVLYLFPNFEEMLVSSSNFDTGFWKFPWLASTISQSWKLDGWKLAFDLI